MQLHLFFVSSFLTQLLNLFEPSKFKVFGGWGLRQSIRCGNDIRGHVTPLAQLHLGGDIPSTNSACIASRLWVTMLNPCPKQIPAAYYNLSPQWHVLHKMQRVGGKRLCWVISFTDKVWKDLLNLVPICQEGIWRSAANNHHHPCVHPA